MMKIWTIEEGPCDTRMSRREARSRVESGQAKTLVKLGRSQSLQDFFRIPIGKIHVSTMSIQTNPEAKSNLGLWYSITPRFPCKPLARCHYRPSMNGKKHKMEKFIVVIKRIMFRKKKFCIITKHVSLFKNSSGEQK